METKKTTTTTRTREVILVKSTGPLLNPANGGGGGSEKPPTGTSGCLWGLVAGLFLYGGWVFDNATPEALHAFLRQFGKWSYVVFLALCLFYFVRMLFRLPLRPDWFKHGELADAAQKSFIIVMVIASLQLAISDWNEEHGTGLHLPKAAFASFVPMFLFACYAIVVKFFSPLKKSKDGVLSVIGGSATSLPAVRYSLSGWYDTYLPWKWF